MPNIYQHKLNATELTCPLKTVPVIKLVFNLNWTQKGVIVKSGVWVN